MYATHSLAAAAIFKRRSEDGRRAHAEHSMDNIDHGTLIPNGFILRSLCSGMLRAANNFG